MDTVSDEFTLYDLRVEVIAGKRPMICNHKVGDYFELSGENLSLPHGQSFPIYPLAALLPLLTAKQRAIQQNDWIALDTDVACPDAQCGGMFRISTVGKRVFRRSEVSANPLET